MVVTPKSYLPHVLLETNIVGSFLLELAVGPRST